MFTTVLLRAAGIAPPQKPDASTVARAAMCKPAVLCKNSDDKDDCDEMKACVSSVNQLVKKNNGGNTVIRNSGNTQKQLFVAQHYDLLTPRAVDRTVSQMQAIYDLIRAIPKWIWVYVLVVGTVITLILIIPVLVIFIRTISNKRAMGKIVAVIVLWVTIVVSYVVIPM